MTTNPPDFTCDEVRDRLVPFEDGELGPSEAALVERHLDTCTACARFADGVARVELPAPPAVDRRLEAELFARLDVALAEARVADVPPRRDLWPIVARVAFAAAAVAAFLAGFTVDRWQPAVVALRPGAADAMSSAQYLPASWESPAPTPAARADDAPVKAEAP